MSNKRKPLLVLSLLAITLILSLGVGSAAAAANPGDVVINEIMQNPSAVSDSAGEWFELYNTTSSDIDINAWTIKDNDFNSHVINNGGPLIIPAGGYLVLGNNTNTATNGGVNVAYSYGSNWYLSNSSDEVVLLDNTSTEIDRVEYDNGATFPDPAGASMALRDPSLDNNIGANWCTSSTTFGAGDSGTPGSANDCPAAPPPPPPPSTELIINELLADPAAGLTGDANGDGTRNGSQDEFVEIVNNSSSGIDISGWTLADGFKVRHTFPAGTIIPSACSIVVFGGGTPTGDFGASLVQTATTGSLGLNNGGDTLTLNDGSSDVAFYTYHGEGGDNQSLTRDPDVTGPGPLVKHSLAAGSGGALFSPGTKIDGSFFDGCSFSATIHDIQFAPDPGGDSPYVGKPVTTQGVVTAVLGDNVFIQDDSGPWSGLLLFRPSPSASVGDLVQVTGSVSEFHGLTEIAFGKVTKLSSGNALPPAEALPSGDISQEQWESVLVRTEDVTVTNDNLGFGEWLVDDSSGGVRIDDLGNYNYTPANGDFLAFVQGPLYYSFGNFKIEPRNDHDILPVVTVMDIQGSGQYSSFEGVVVETSGIVTLFTANGNNCWIQDPAGDGDPATSDGIYVSGCAFADVGPVPAVGDAIRIIASVQERQFGNALPLTRLSSVDEIEVLSSGNTLPAPVTLTDLPNESIANGIAFWEPLEGMLVSVEKARVVGATSRFGEFAILTKEDARPGSGYSPKAKQILISSQGNGVVDYNPERILVDDSSLASALIVMPGDKVRRLTGVVDYTFGNYKLQPASFDIKTKERDDQELDEFEFENEDDEVVITSFNVENLFDLENNPNKDDRSSTPTPEELETKLTKLTLAIIFELEAPQIIVVEEVENTAILQVLGDRVNAAIGTNYTATSFETSDGRGIEVGFLWDANRVMLKDAFQLSGEDVEAAFGPDSASPGREPLVGIFDIQGEEITIIGNHFKSKGGDDPLYGVNWPPNRITEVQRKMQAQVVRDYVNVLLDANPEAMIMVTGDLNDFQFAEPGEGTDHPVGILEGGPGEIPLTNLVNRVHAQKRFTFVFDGNSQVLDHMLVSPALLEHFHKAKILHFNAGYPEAFSSDPTTTWRASDHDPIEGQFRFEEDD
ncbi:MAG: lamin tail domain-containing protein [Anaerolineae bacterium]